MVHGKSRLQGYKNSYVGSPSLRCIIHPSFFGVLGEWMTFKKAEMKKLLRKGLSLFCFVFQHPLYKQIIFPVHKAITIVRFLFAANKSNSFFCSLFWVQINRTLFFAVFFGCK